MVWAGSKSPARSKRRRRSRDCDKGHPGATHLVTRHANCSNLPVSTNPPNYRAVNRVGSDTRVSALTHPIHSGGRNSCVVNLNPPEACLLGDNRHTLIVENAV